ncbi:KH domain-containing protein [bacterium]|nr:KH domain-containing protein [bacterium]
MKDLLEYIVKAIVNNPDEVSVSEKESVDFQGLIIYSIKVAQQDKGVVIGRKGRTINAIRDLVTIAAIRQQKRVKVLVEEDEMDRPVPTASDDSTPTEDMLEDNMEQLG